MSMLDGFEPMKLKRSYRSKWRSAELVAEFLEREETRLGKEYEDEDELKRRINSLRQYLRRPSGRNLGVSVHRRGNFLILCKDGEQNG